MRWLELNNQKYIDKQKINGGGNMSSKNVERIRWILKEISELTPEEMVEFLFQLLLKEF